MTDSRQNEASIDARIEKAIEVAGIIPELCEWSGGKRIVIEIGEVAPRIKVHVEDFWDIERIVNALRSALDAAREARR